MAFLTLWAPLSIPIVRDVVVPIFPGQSRSVCIRTLVRIAGSTEVFHIESALETRRSTNEWPEFFTDRVASFEFGGVAFPFDMGLNDFSPSIGATGVIAANFASEFSSRIDSYILTPTALVMNPADPYDFVFERQMIFSLSENILHPSVSALVSVAESSTGTESLMSSPPRFHEFRISTGIFKDVVPPDVMEVLAAELQLRHIRTRVRRSHDHSRRITGINLPNCSPAVVSDLPILQYAIRGDLDTVTYIRLYGEDYIEYTTSDQTSCELTLASVEEMGSCSIGLNTLRKTVLYIDNRNHMIGFGEII